MQNHADLVRQYEPILKNEMTLLVVVAVVLTLMFTGVILFLIREIKDERVKKLRMGE